MKIDCENKLSEKKAKELSTSLNYLVNNIINVLLKKNVERGSFKIKFDNDSVFSIITFKEKVFVSYVDKYQKKKEMLSLQDALNINKYARDIEYHLLQIYILLMQQALYMSFIMVMFMLQVQEGIGHIQRKKYMNKLIAL